MALKGRVKIHRSIGFTRDGVIDKGESEESDDIEEVKVCDICGKDASGLSSCFSCHQDLCREHQIDVMGRLMTGGDRTDVAPPGVYCRTCLISQIKAAVDR